MTDSASLYSTTDTLVDVPVLDSSLSSYQAGDVGPIHVSLYSNYDRSPPNAERLTRVGFPSTQTRGQASTGRLPNPLSSLRKRLQCQIPVRDARFAWQYAPEASSVDEVEQRIKEVPTSRRIATLWELQLAEVTGIRNRPRLAIIFAALYKAMDLRENFSVFPASRVLSCHPSLREKDDGGAKVGMHWASVTLTAPAWWVDRGDDPDTEQQEEEEDRRNAEQHSGEDTPSPTQEEVDAFWSQNPTLHPSHRETPAELLARLSPPSRHAQRTLDRIIACLERQGAMLSNAGFSSRPSAARRDPRKRPTIQLIGLFPQFMMAELKRAASRKRGALSAEDAMLLAGAGQEVQLLVRTDDEAGDADSDKVTEATKHMAVILQGWQVRLQNEPYLKGTPHWGGMLGAMGGGMAFGGMGGGF